MPNPLRALLIFGTRPEAIKMAPVVHECRRRAHQIESIVCLTGQHREMLAQVTDYFGIRADVDLDLMRPNQTLAGLTARCLEAIDEAIVRLRPDCVVAQGDTTTVMAVAMAAFYRRVPMVHVEAGLRTGNLDAPWPEEFNRRVADMLTSLYCAPTRRAAEALLAEGVPPSRVHVTGNTVIDALLETVGRERAHSAAWQAKYAMLGSRPMVLVTGHRRESFGQGFENICRAIASLAERFPQCEFVYPVHLNPNVQGPVYRALAAVQQQPPSPAPGRAGVQRQLPSPAPGRGAGGEGIRDEDTRSLLGGRLGARPNIHLTAPAGYPEFVWLMDRSTLILTDSGGVQEEAPSLRKPVLVMRDTTERPEAVEAGAARLVGTSVDAIVEGVCSLLTDPAQYAACQIPENPYGDGRAAKRIVELMLCQGWGRS